MTDSLLNETASQINELEQFNDDLFSILDEGNIDVVMLERLTGTILKDLKCTEVSLWTIGIRGIGIRGTGTSIHAFMCLKNVCK